MEPYPIKFENVFNERIWGGRNLEWVLDKPLPPGDEPIGESWVVDHRSDSGSRLNRFRRFSPGTDHSMPSIVNLIRYTVPAFTSLIVSFPMNL